MFHSSETELEEVLSVSHYFYFSHYENKINNKSYTENNTANSHFFETEAPWLRSRFCKRKKGQQQYFINI